MKYLRSKNVREYVQDTGNAITYRENRILSRSDNTSKVASIAVCVTFVK